MNLHLKMNKWQWAIIVAIVALINVPFLVRALRPAQVVTVHHLPFQDDFNREAIGPNYFSAGGAWRIVDGALQSPGVKNNPLWLSASLPRDVVVEFDAMATTQKGDLKCEIFGNGWDHASGYVVIMGGWSNKVSIIARLDEHGKDRKENREVKVEKGKYHHFRIQRQGGKIDWFVDGNQVLTFDDPQPLVGEGHDRFGFSSWDSESYFDNLTITPL